MRFPFSPIDYHEPVFRPPSEASSFILQITLGCSWNRCAFCEMYQSKRFRVRSLEEIESDLKQAARLWPDTRRVFLADGDPLVLAPSRLLPILEMIRKYLPAAQRISAYASPRNLAARTVEELAAIRGAGLNLVYVGIESGDDCLLERIQKGETAATIISGLNHAAQAGIRRSVMILIGLGGETLSRQHAEQSARVVNETRPEHLSTLVLRFPLGENRFRSLFGADYRPLDYLGHLREMRFFLCGLSLDRTVFRSDHISNVLALRGTLSRDRDPLVARLDRFLLDIEKNPGPWERAFRDRDQRSL